MTALPLDPARIEAAARAIDPVRTGSPPFDAEALGCQLPVEAQTVTASRPVSGRRQPDDGADRPWLVDRH